MNNFIYLICSIAFGLMISFMSSFIIERKMKKHLNIKEIICIESRKSIETLLKEVSKSGGSVSKEIELQVWSNVMDYMMTSHSFDNAIHVLRILDDVTEKLGPDGNNYKIQSKQVLEERFGSNIPVKC